MAYGKGHETRMLATNIPGSKVFIFCFFFSVSWASFCTSSLASLAASILRQMHSCSASSAAHTAASWSATHWMALWSRLICQAMRRCTVACWLFSSLAFLSPWWMKRSHPQWNWEGGFSSLGSVSRPGQLQNNLQNVQRLVSDRTWLQQLGEEHCTLVKSLSQILECRDNSEVKT